MSCMLRISGENFDVDAFAEKVQIPEFRKHYKGEPIVKSSKRKNKSSGVSLATSEADFDDFKTQVEDTIRFLTQYKDKLKIIAYTPDIEHAIIDFGITSALSEERLMQTFYITKDLIKLCAELNIEIMLSTYKEDMQLILERNRQEKESKKD